MDPEVDHVVVPVELGAHHDGSARYVGTERPAPGDRVPIRVQVPRGSGVETVRIRVLRDAEPFFVDAVPDGSDEGVDWFTAEVEMHNPVTAYRVQLDRGSRGYSWVNGTGEHDRDLPDAHDFRLTTFDPGPAWAQESVVYQIFPDRFAKSQDREPPAWAVPAGWDDPVVHRGPDTPRQFFGGDIDGITEHLDHVQELGADAVYLTPVFPARSNHRYNASDFDMVDPLLGGDDALVRLSAACHARGLRLIGDLTTNHSGDDHPWFQAAMGDPAAPERHFYYFDEAGEYVSWLGHRTLPKFDLFSTELRNLMFGPADSVVARWLRPPFDLDGWRIDVANMTGRQGVHDHGNDVAVLIRSTLDAVAPGSALLAEYTGDFTADLRGDGWQGSMNYAGFGRPVWSWLIGAEYEQSLLGVPARLARRTGQQTAATMRDFAAAVPWKVASRHWNLTSSHDTARIRTVTGSAEGVGLAAVLLFTYLGAPMVFAGDEWGLQGVDGEDARRPMPWHQPGRRDTQTFDAYRELIALRRAHPALRRGSLRWVLESADALAYLRETDDERLLVVVARARWTGALLPRSLAPSAAVETLYGPLDLDVTDRGVRVSGDGPTAGIWRLG